jgi:uncharacterized membrane protein
MDLVLLKLVHILATIVALGANLTYLAWLRAAGRDRDRIGFAIAGIRRIDRRLANPAYVVVLLSGLAMVWRGPFAFLTPGSGWLDVSLALYLLTAVLGVTVFAPALRRQQALAESDPAGHAYAAAARRTEVLFAVVTAIVLTIVVLMVTKPF